MSKIKKKDEDSSFAKNLALYDALVATHPKAERCGTKIPSTSLGGRMYSFLGKTGEVALKLPEAEREAFLKKYKTRLCDVYGIVQKEFVMIPDSLLAKTQECKKYFAMSYAYATTLKPTKAASAAKATAKKKSA
jgi:hypothetical protein